MTDIQIVFKDGGGDIEIIGDSLRVDDGLSTAVLISLFSDARDDSNGDDKRGYWADTEDDRYGSLLWRLLRGKASVATVLSAKDWTESALAWMVEDGVCESVEVTTELVSRSVMGIRVILNRGDERRWSHLWEGVKNYTMESSGLNFEIVFN